MTQIKDSLFRYGFQDSVLLLFRMDFCPFLAWGGWFCRAWVQLFLFSGICSFWVCHLWSCECHLWVRCRIWFTPLISSYSRCSRRSGDSFWGLWVCFPAGFDPYFSCGTPNCCRRWTGTGPDGKFSLMVEYARSFSGATCSLLCGVTSPLCL